MMLTWRKRYIDQADGYKSYFPAIRPPTINHFLFSLTAEEKKIDCGWPNGQKKAFIAIDLINVSPVPGKYYWNKFVLHRANLLR